ncbi:DUF3987 domain-containing protein [Methylobacterium sp. E-005]|uniref:YfjI family protein n=1 Tax=Methylobacterium sp. E-005 TaxID=2836549 RepID=UPI001FB86FBB|nr:YfjI family protein [Methylobacterium sp. E-005]MCJ2086379.1 DUF3987 domain-containing protein [Methylobacterium sp. E-005]
MPVNAAEALGRIHRETFVPRPDRNTGRGPSPIQSERDRLVIAPALSAATPFPIEALPPVMRAAVEALEDHVQAPRSLCAHSVISAAMLVCQGLADVKVESLPAPVPMSLFMLAIAVSGELFAIAEGATWDDYDFELGQFFNELRTGEAA